MGYSQPIVQPLPWVGWVTETVQWQWSVLHQAVTQGGCDRADMVPTFADYLRSSRSLPVNQDWLDTGAAVPQRT